jgi:hypothetical protein
MLSSLSGVFSKVLPTILDALGGLFRKRHMRSQLYQEISQNNHRIVVHIERCTTIKGFSQGEPLRFPENLGLSFAMWNFYAGDEKRKERLFGLKDATAIVRIYEKFKAVDTDSTGYALVRGKVAAAEVDDSLVDGSLDRKLYQNVSSKEAWEYMAILLNGKRESYRYYLNPLTRPIR